MTDPIVFYHESQRLYALADSLDGVLDPAARKAAQLMTSHRFNGPIADRVTGDLGQSQSRLRTVADDLRREAHARYQRYVHETMLVTQPPTGPPPATPSGPPPVPMPSPGPAPSPR